MPTVSTVAALNTAIANAVNGETIYLTGGEWADPLARTSTTTFSKTNPVKIMALDTANPPRFTTIPSSGKPAWQMVNHTGFVIDGITFVGSKYSELATYAGGPFPTQRAMLIDNSHGITIQNCLFDFWKENIGFTSGAYSDIIFRCNEIRRWGMDAIRIYKPIDRFMCEKNYVHSAKVFTGRATTTYDCSKSAQWNAQNGNTHPCGRHHNWGQHPDVLQYALNGTDKAGSDHTIRNNYFRGLDYNNYYCHNIFIYSERVHGQNDTAADAFLNNVQIYNNLIYCGHWNAIALCGMRGNSSVHHNKIIGFSPLGTCSYCNTNLTFTPMIQIYEGVGTASQKVEIYNNHVWQSSYVGYQGDATSAGITFTNNVVSQSETARPAGWVDFTYGRYSDGTVEPVPTQLTIATRPATQTAFAAQSGESGVAATTLPIIGTPSTSTSSNAPAFTAYQTGNIILAFAVNTGAAADITVPAGWTVAAAELDGPNMTSVLAWRYAASDGADTLGTWTNASFVKYIALASVAPTGAVKQVASVATASGATIANPALPSALSGKSVVMTFTIQRLNTEGALPGTRTDATSIDSKSSAGGQHFVIAKSTAVPPTGTWALQNVAGAGGNSGQGHSWAIEIEGLTAGSSSMTVPIDMPVNAPGGQTLITVVSSDGAPTITIDSATSSAGWTAVATAAQSTNVKQHVFVNFESAGEDENGIPQDRLGLTFSAAEAFTAITYLYEGARSPLYTAFANADSTNANPPSLTPAGGEDDYSWLVTGSWDAAVVPSAPPAGFTDMRTQAGSATSASTAMAERELRGTVLDPGTFTSATAQHVVGTIAIRPTTGFRPAHHGAIVSTYNEQIDWLGNGTMVTGTSGIISIAPDTPAFVACAGDPDDLDLDWKLDSMTSWKPVDKATATGKDAAGNLAFRMRPDFTAYSAGFPTSHRSHSIAAGETLSNIRIRYKAASGTVFSAASAYSLSFTAAGSQSFTPTSLDSALPVPGTPALSQRHGLTPQGVLVGTIMPGVPTFSVRQALVSLGLTMNPSPAIGSSSVTSAHSFGAVPLVSQAADIGIPQLLQVGGSSSQAFIAEGVTSLLPALGSPQIGQRQGITPFSLTVLQAAAGTSSLTQGQGFVPQSLLAGTITPGVPTFQQRQSAVATDLVTPDAILGTPGVTQSLGQGGLVAALPELNGYGWGQNAVFTPQTMVSVTALLGVPAVAQTNPDVAAGWDRDWRKHLRKTRRIVHDTMGIRAVYALSGTQVGRIVRVRPRFKIDQNEAEGSSMNDTDMKVLFDRTEVPMPMVNGYIAFASGEIYKIRDAEAPYMGYITVSVVPVPEAAATNLWPIIVPSNFT